MTQANQISLEQFRVMGIDRSPNTGIYLLGETTVVYFAGNNIVSHNWELKKQKFLPYTDTARGDVKCVAVSPPTQNGQVFLAYSLELDASIIYIVELNTLKRQKSITLPNSTMSFTALAFSAGARYLIAMGNTDSQIFYFDITNGSLVVSQKVTGNASTSTFNTSVNCISFHPTDVNTICCTGKGVYKLLVRSDKGFNYKQTPSKDTYDFKEHIFVGLDSRIIASSTDGHLYCLDTPNYSMQIPIKNQTNGPITNLTLTPKGFVCVTGGNTIHFFDKQADLKNFTEGNSIVIDENSTIVALAVSPGEDKLMALMNDARLIAIPLNNTDPNANQNEGLVTVLPSHHIGVVTGIDVAYRKQLLVTCGEDQSIRVWNYDKMVCEVNHYCKDPPLSVSFHPNGCFMIVGFPEKIAYLAVTVNDLVVQHEFGIRNCKDLKFSHGGQYFAAVNQNSVSVYSSYTFKPVVTIRSQGQRVATFAWSTDDNHIITCDMSGQMGIWVVRSGKSRTSLTSQQTHHFISIVATDPTCARCYGITAPDNTLRETEDTQTKNQLDVVAVPCQVVMGPSNRCLFVSTRNGTIRIYHFPGTSNSVNNFPTTDSVTETVAHHTPVTAIVTSPDFQYLFSSGEDGCIYMMKINGVDQGNQRSDAKITFSEDVLITRSENVEQLKKLRAAQQRVREQSETNANKLATLNQGFEQSIKTIQEKFAAEQAAENQNMAALEQQIEQMNQEACEQIQATNKRFANEEEQKLKRFEMSKENEMNQQEQLKLDIEEARKEWDEKLKKAIAANQASREEAERKFQEQLRSLAEETQRVQEEKNAMIEEYDKWEIERSRELAFEIGKREFEALQLRKEELKKSAELEQQSKRMEEQLKEAKAAEADARDKLNKKAAEVAGKQTDIAQARHLKETRIHELKELKHNLEEKDARIDELTKQNSNLEKHKQLLNDRIADWNKKLEPDQAKLQDITITCERMQQEMQRYNKNHEQLRLESNELRLKIDAKLREIDTRTKEYEEVRQIIRQFKLEVHNVYQALEQDKNNTTHKPKRFSPCLEALYKKYVGDESSSKRKTGVTDIQIERNRQRDALERNITAVARRLSRGDEESKRTQERKMAESVTLMTQISDLRRQIQNLRMKKEILEESHKSMFSQEELHKIIQMQEGRIKELTTQLKQLQLRGNVSRRPAMSKERLPPMNINE